MSATSEQLYVYSLHICQGTELYQDCSPPPQANTRVVQIDETHICHSLGMGDGVLRYVDDTLSLTYSRGETCHSNFARTSLITFVCPSDLDKDNSNTSVRFLGEEDCFYQFEWVTNLACGGESSGVSGCQFELHDMGVYNLAPLVGTQDDNWVAVSGDSSYSCFMLNPCGRLIVTETIYNSGPSYCKTRKAPTTCVGASVCAVFPDGSAAPIGIFDLEKQSSITSIDKYVVSISGPMANSSDSAIIHYVCKPGDLSSAPVFIGVVDQFSFEFHWNTYAACPSGLQMGSDCSVFYQGNFFNLSSIPVLRFNSSDDAYMYEISVCLPLQTAATHCSKNGAKMPAICQVRSNGKHYVLGLANSSLVYEDGTLRLTYSGGDMCHNNVSRKTVVLFLCDRSSHTASVSSVTEDLCTYVVEVRTKLACPVANRATECIHFHEGRSYDFSDLSRAQDQGNWEARGPDGSKYFINVCQPLNHVAGCSPLASVCRVVPDGTHMTYTNLGLAYNSTFYQDENDHVKLEYEFPGSSPCPKVHTTIEFVCTNRTTYTEV